MKKYGPFATRVGIGGLFLATGIMKLLDPSMVEGMLDGMGFPAAALLTWLLIFVEVLGGAAVLVGFKLKYVTVPLAIVLLVASVVMIDQPGIMVSNLALLAATVGLWFSGPGAWAVSKN